jgi:hypothetical protein
MELVNVLGKVMHADQELVEINQQSQIKNAIPSLLDAKQMEPHALPLKHAQISMEIRNIVRNHILDHVYMSMGSVMITLNVKMHQVKLMQFAKLFHLNAQQMGLIVFQ